MANGLFLKNYVTAGHNGDRMRGWIVEKVARECRDFVVCTVACTLLSLAFDLSYFGDLSLTKSPWALSTTKERAKEQ